MFYHICPPDIKLISSLVDRFECIKPGFNRCVIIVSKHHLTPKVDLDRSLIEYFGPLNVDIVQRIRRSDCAGVIVHTLNDDILELSLNLASFYPIVWRSWGTDLHDIIYPNIELLLPVTKELVYGKNSIFGTSIKMIRFANSFVGGHEKRRIERIQKKQEFLYKVNYIATTIRKEFELLQAALPGLQADFLTLNYRSLDLKTLPILRARLKGRSLMVGHSSYSYHNHADILLQLKKDSFIGEISVPLSYGNNNYRKKIIKIGKQLFPGQIHFPTNFMSFIDYLDYLRGFDSFILNSKVQSGGGNIIYSLYQGLKVYLREENPLYQYYREKGICLYTIQNHLNFSHLNNEAILLKDQVVNREILESLYSTRKERENVRNVYKALRVSI